MKKIIIPLILCIIFFSNFSIAQEISKSIKKNPNELFTVHTARYLTFNEYWIINHLGSEKILLSDYFKQKSLNEGYDILNHLGSEKILLKDFYKQKSLKEGYRMKNDSLSSELYSIAIKNELYLRSSLGEIYKDKAEYIVNELFLDMLLSHSKESIKRFKDKRDKITKEIMDNEKDYPDSVYNLIRYQDIKNRFNYSGSIELKRFSDQKYYDSHMLIKRNYGLSISLSIPTFSDALIMNGSFDINLVQFFNQKYTKYQIGYFPSLDGKYYLNEYSDTSQFKVTPSLSYSLGILLINNNSLNASLSWFFSAFFTRANYGYLCSGISFASNIYLPKYYQEHNINGIINSKKAIKLAINFDIINKQASIGIGFSLNKITQLNFLNTNMF